MCLQDKQHLYFSKKKKKKEIYFKRDPATCLHDGWVKFERRGFNMPFDDESLLSSPLFLACSSLKEETASEEICEDLPWKTDSERYNMEVKVAEDEKDVLVFVMEMNKSLVQSFFL